MYLCVCCDTASSKTAINKFKQWTAVLSQKKTLTGSADSITSTQKGNAKKPKKPQTTALRICLDKVQAGKMGKAALLVGYARAMEASKPLVERFVCRP